MDPVQCAHSVGKRKEVRLLSKVLRKYWSPPQCFNMHCLLRYAVSPKHEQVGKGIVQYASRGKHPPTPRLWARAFLPWPSTFLYLQLIKLISNNAFKEWIQNESPDLNRSDMLLSCPQFMLQLCTVGQLGCLLVSQRQGCWKPGLSSHSHRFSRGDPPYYFILKTASRSNMCIKPSCNAA